MNRRFFMRALAASLGFFGISKFAKAEPEFKYSKFFRRCDEAIMDEFRDIVYMDEAGKVFKVPLIWATDDKAESILQIESQPIKLPLMNIYRGDVFFNEKICSYYHLTVRTMYEEHMNQVLEQAVIKFHPKLKNKVGTANLISMINNYYPGGSHASMYPLAECHPLRGEIYSGLKHGKQCEWGKQGEWVFYKPEDVKVLKHQFNLILVCEGRP